jgi:ribosomal protein S18 acetylase RimI-like enzyme
MDWHSLPGCFILFADGQPLPMATLAGRMIHFCMEVMTKAPRKRAKPLPPVEIREMELRDVAAVFELGQKLFTAEEWPSLYRSWDDHELALLFSNDAETCLIAEADGNVIGFALGRVMEKPRSAWRYGWLLWLGVDRRFKRSGIATRLIKQLKGLFIERDARIMLVDTAAKNHSAVAFFRRNGFGQEIRHVYLSQNLENDPRYIERKDNSEDDTDD